MAKFGNPIVTQWETQTVHNDVIRQFLLIQFKYETIYCRTIQLTYNAICFRTLRNFNYSLPLIHVWSTSLSSFPTDDYSVNLFSLYAIKFSAKSYLFLLKAADLLYINMKVSEIIIFSILNFSCVKDCTSVSQNIRSLLYCHQITSHS